MVDTYRELFSDNMELLRTVTEEQLADLVNILEARHNASSG